MPPGFIEAAFAVHGIVKIGTALFSHRIDEFALPSYCTRIPTAAA